MTTHQNAGMQLDPRAQATFNALAGVALNPSIVRNNCIVGIVIAGFFVALFAIGGIATFIICLIGAGAAGAVAGVMSLFFALLLSIIPGIIIWRLSLVLKSLPK